MSDFRPNQETHAQSHSANYPDAILSLEEVSRLLHEADCNEQDCRRSQELAYDDLQKARIAVDLAEHRLHAAEIKLMRIIHIAKKSGYKLSKATTPAATTYIGALVQVDGELLLTLGSKLAYRQEMPQSSMAAASSKGPKRGATSTNLEGERNTKIAKSGQSRNASNVQEKTQGSSRVSGLNKDKTVADARSQRPSQSTAGKGGQAEQLEKAFNRIRPDLNLQADERRKDNRLFPEQTYDNDFAPPLPVSCQHQAAAQKKSQGSAQYRRPAHPDKPLMRANPPSLQLNTQDSQFGLVLPANTGISQTANSEHNTLASTQPSAAAAVSSVPINTLPPESLSLGANINSLSNTSNNLTQASSNPSGSFGNPDFHLSQKDAITYNHNPVFHPGSHQFTFSGTSNTNAGSTTTQNAGASTATTNFLADYGVRQVYGAQSYLDSYRYNYHDHSLDGTAAQAGRMNDIGNMSFMEQLSSANQMDTYPTEEEMETHNGPQLFLPDNRVDDNPDADGSVQGENSDEDSEHDDRSKDLEIDEASPSEDEAAAYAVISNASRSNSTNSRGKHYYLDLPMATEKAPTVNRLQDAQQAQSAISSRPVSSAATPNSDSEEEQNDTESTSARRRAPRNSKKANKNKAVNLGYYSQEWISVLRQAQKRWQRHLIIGRSDPFPEREHHLNEARTILNEVIAESLNDGQILDDTYTHTREMDICVFNEHSTWRLEMKKIAASIVASSYHDQLTVPHNYTSSGRTSANEKIKKDVKNMIDTSTFLHFEEDEQGRKNNLNHPAIMRILHATFYSGSDDCLAALFPEDFSRLVPDTAFAFAMTLIQNCLEEYLALGYQPSNIALRGETYRPVFNTMMAAIDEVRADPYHRTKYEANRATWARLGMSMLEQTKDIPPVRKVKLYLD